MQAGPADQFGVAERAQTWEEKKKEKLLVVPSEPKRTTNGAVAAERDAARVASRTHLHD